MVNLSEQASPEQLSIYFDNQLEFAKLVSIFPSTKEAAADPFFCSDQESLEGQARCIQSKSIDRGFDNQVREDLRNLIREQFAAAMLGQKDATQAMADAEQAMTQLLNR